MALLETAVYTLLGEVTGIGPVHPLFVDQNARAPFTVYQRISGERVRSLTGPSGMAEARIQIDNYADNYEDAKEGAAAIRRALDGYSGTVAGVRIGGCSLQNDADLFEAETDPKLFRVTQDFLFIHDEV